MFYNSSNKIRAVYCLSILLWEIDDVFNLSFVLIYCSIMSVMKHNQQYTATSRDYWQWKLCLAICGMITDIEGQRRLFWLTQSNFFWLLGDDHRKSMWKATNQFYLQWLDGESHPVLARNSKQRKCLNHAKDSVFL